MEYFNKFEDFCVRQNLYVHFVRNFTHGQPLIVLGPVPYKRSFPEGPFGSDQANVLY
jgi:hypothetical protein